MTALKALLSWLMPTAATLCSTTQAEKPPCVDGSELQINMDFAKYLSKI